MTLAERMSTTLVRSGEDRRVASPLPRALALAAAWVASAYVALPQLIYLGRGGWGGDALIYWNVWHRTPMYDAAPGTANAWLYPPIVADVLWPLTLLPWLVFAAAWVAAAIAVYLWLVRPLRWMWAVPLLGLALEDIRVGNCLWLLALACVLGVRRSGWWLVPALVKVGPGVGVLWFAARRQWRPLLVTAAAGAVIVAVAVALQPGLWLEWVGFMRANGSPLAAVRVLIAAGLVWWAGRTDRAWWLPVAMVFASPVWGFWPLALLCAVPRLLPAEALAWANAPFRGVRASVRALAPQAHV